MLLISDNPKDYQFEEFERLKAEFPLEKSEIGITTAKSLLEYPTLKPMVMSLILKGVIQPSDTMAVAYKSTFENESE